MNKSIKILTIVGARPQFIKSSSISKEIYNHNKLNNKNRLIQEVIIHTGQHYDHNMSDIFFSQLGMSKPQYNLNINKLSHGEMTARMLEQIEKIAINEEPDCVLVYGDTNSTLAGALAASKLHIPIAHIEAGLRSYNKKMPEEINRILTDHISTFLFCPTKKSIKNLEVENISNNKNIHVVFVGDVMIDTINNNKIYAKKPSFKLPCPYILATVHREENIESEYRLQSIFNSLSIIGKNEHIVIPLHPRTKNFIKKFKIKIDKEHIKITKPVSYLEMIYLLDNCSMVITDSGGLQKESFFFKKYCLTLREETEWEELVKAKVNRTSNIEVKEILSNWDQLFSNRLNNFPEKNFYGNGDASKKVINYLARNLANRA